MNSEVVVHGERRSAGRLHKLNPLGLLRRLVLRRAPVDADYDPDLEKERLLGQALTRREQEAYERATGLEREAYDAAISSSGASLAGAYRDLETATGIIRDSGIREARRLGHLWYETRQKSNVTQLRRPAIV